MNTRIVGYSDYHIGEPEKKTLLELCRNADSQTELLLLKAAQEAYAEYASSLFYSLRSGASYESICCNNYLYMIKNDFYAYRRQTLYLLKEKLMMNDEVIVEKWQQDGYIRRYLPLEKAMEETMIDETKLRELAKKANAMIKWGHLVRINMIALYDYLDRECTMQQNLG